MECTVDECDTPAKTCGLCVKHYWRRWANGTTDLIVRTSNEIRFARYTPNRDGCWVWTGPIAEHNGYGRLYLDGPRPKKRQAAHVYAYLTRVGPIPDGYEIDHLCKVRACVNPEHLEAVTHRENIRRSNVGKATAARHRARTHCKRGHELTEANLYRRPSGLSRRECKECKRIEGAERYERSKRAA